LPSSRSSPSTASADPSITKWDIFHYIYAVLHHPDYRERYAANLRRELPRIPFASATSPTLSSRAEQDRLKNDPAQSRDPVPASSQQRPGKEFSERTSGSDEAPPSANLSPGGAADNSPGRKSGVDQTKENNTTLPKAVAGERSSQATGITTDLALFHAFVKAGQRLAEIHVHYESQPEYPLTKIEKKGEKLDYRVTKMKLTKDKTSLIYNQFLTLSGIPPETYEYRLGNRSALEWIIDQIPGLHRQTQRHHQRPQPRRRPDLHPSPHRPGR
jgi:Type ISP C-terminal specificity domain